MHYNDPSRARILTRPCYLDWNSVLPIPWVDLETLIWNIPNRHGHYQVYQKYEYGELGSLIQEYFDDPEEYLVKYFQWDRYDRPKSKLESVAEKLGW